MTKIKSRFRTISCWLSSGCACRRRSIRTRASFMILWCIREMSLAANPEVYLLTAMCSDKRLLDRVAGCGHCRWHCSPQFAVSPTYRIQPCLVATDGAPEGSKATPLRICELRDAKLLRIVWPRGLCLDNVGDPRYCIVSPAGIPLTAVVALTYYLRLIYPAHASY